MPEGETTEVRADEEVSEEEDEETPEEREEKIRVLEEARRQYEEIKEEDYHPTYKRLIGLVPPAGMFKEKDGVVMGKCEGCGKEVPESELSDNGNFLACKDCI